MSFPIENRAGMSEPAFASLAAVLAGQRSFKHALDWMYSHMQPLLLDDIFAQDEYSHDAIVSGWDGLVLVYDVT